MPLSRDLQEQIIRTTWSRELSATYDADPGLWVPVPAPQNACEAFSLCRSWIVFPAVEPAVGVEGFEPPRDIVHKSSNPPPLVALAGTAAGAGVVGVAGFIGAKVDAGEGMMLLPNTVAHWWATGGCRRRWCSMGCVKEIEYVGCGFAGGRRRRCHDRLERGCGNRGCRRGRRGGTLEVIKVID
jgi:hypothetical protein